MHPVYTGPVKHLYFMRHGLTVLNKEGLFAGSTETPLAPEGIEQAKIAGNAAKQLNIDLIVCSMQGRALETAQIIAKELGIPTSSIVQNKLLNERDFGPYEQTPWSADFDFAAAKGMEPTEELLQRSHQAYEWLKSLPANTILVVGHGAAGRALRSVLNPNVPFDDQPRFPNAEIVQLI